MTLSKTTSLENKILHTYGKGGEDCDYKYIWFFWICIDNKEPSRTWCTKVKIRYILGEISPTGSCGALVYVEVVGKTFFVFFQTFISFVERQPLFLEKNTSRIFGLPLHETHAFIYRLVTICSRYCCFFFHFSIRFQFGCCSVMLSIRFNYRPFCLSSAKLIAIQFVILLDFLRLR